MALPLLGGLILAGLGRYGLDEYEGYQQQQRTDKLNSLLGPIMSQLQQDPNNTQARLQYQDLLTGAGRTNEQVRTGLEQFDRVDGFRNQNERGQAINTLSTDYNKQITPYRATIEKFQNSVELVQRKGGYESLTGTDDIALMKNYMKMVLPNEAVMSDDQAAVEQAKGYPGVVSRFAKMISGDGTLSADARAEILQSMEQLAQSNMTGYEEVRGMFGDRAGSLNVGTDMFMRPEMIMPSAPGSPQAQMQQQLRDEQEELEYLRQKKALEERAQMRGMIQR